MSDLPVSGSQPIGGPIMSAVPGGSSFIGTNFSADGAQITVGGNLNSNNTFLQQFLCVLSPGAGEGNIDPTELIALLNSQPPGDPSLLIRLLENQRISQITPPTQLESHSQDQADAGASPSPSSSQSVHSVSSRNFPNTFTTYRVAWYLLQNTVSAQPWKLPGAFQTRFSSAARKAISAAKYIKKVEDLYSSDVFIRQRTEDGDYIYKMGHLDAQNQDFLIKLWNNFTSQRSQFYELGDWRKKEVELTAIEGGLKQTCMRAQVASTRLKHTIRGLPPGSESPSSGQDTEPIPSTEPLAPSSEERALLLMNANVSSATVSALVGGDTGDNSRPGSPAAGSIQPGVPVALFYKDRSGSFLGPFNASRTSVISQQSSHLSYDGQGRPLEDEVNPVVFVPGNTPAGERNI